MKRIIETAIVILLLCLTGCKSKEVAGTRQPSAAPDKEVLYKGLLDTYTPWETFSAKATASFAGSNLRSSVEIRMVRGKAIQVSIRPLLGIEIARLLMTTDSVFVYDKFNKRYIAEALDGFYDLMPVAITPCELQNILLGRPFIIGDELLTDADMDKFDFVVTNNADWALQPKEQYKLFTYRFLLSGKNLMGLQAYNTNATKQISCSYANQHITGNHALPSFVQLTAQGSSRKYTLSINYDVSTATWDSPFEIEKLPSAGYTIMNFEQLLKSLIP